MAKPMAEPKTTEQKTALQRALEFEAKREALRSQAKEETLTTINSLLEELTKLGFKYQLVEASQVHQQPVQPKEEHKTIQRQRDPNKPCSYCGQLGHDARKHRAEIIAKKAAAKEPQKTVTA